ncbi:hypothetical protein MAC_01158 [Metarhizium acridum CQMa 102]|uniref:Tetratricopeptide-like helical n=1 Tax=Metarhizium acridum (strain CQMa 102) TaxID=655827 RepID=E9DU60_METAQ|nr:uncharacterized protein MAC_01158 [Metarhizium acridum CQMa 102]EFY92920.1 hypothetical protein MAC_01158 [Metarhizium acridum CQMa 102]
MSSSRDVEGETALADMVVSGRQSYEAQQYKRALEQFTRAMKYCPCARGVKRERCTCKNFERVAAEEGSIFKEAMYNCKCDVGRTFNKCDNRNHIQALDYRAATFEALGKLDRAKKDAEWILELAPRLPDLTLLLRASPCLEYLEIGPQFDILMFPPKENMWTKLRHVSINGTGDPAKPAWSTPVIPIGGFPLAFLNNAAASLEHLVLTGIPEQWYMTQSVPFLPNLKTLRMCNISTLRQSFPIFFLSDAFPRLEQLWIGPNIPNLDSNSLSGWREKWHTMWNHLKVLIFEESSVVGPISQVENSLLTLRLLTCLNNGNSLQHIRFDIPSDNEDRHGRHRVFSNSRTLYGDIDIPQYPEFRNLHSLASKSLCISPDILRIVFSDALNMGKIQSFDIVFPIESLNDRIGDRSITHLKGYEWLRGAASITSMGCYRFRFRSYPRNDDDLPLPPFLASFPNLKTLSIFSEHYEEAEFAGVVAAILKVTTLKTIYTTSVKGAVMDQLRTVAESQGVKLIWGHQPQAWPVPLDES